MAKPALLIALLMAAAVLLTGCTGTEEAPIPPLAPAAGRVDPGLGPGTRALSSGPGYKGSPDWDPDGTRIAFWVLNESFTSAQVFSMAADGTNPRRLTKGGFSAFPDWQAKP